MNAMLLAVACCLVLQINGSPAVFYENDNNSLKPTSTMRYEHTMQLDASGDYWMFWTANTTHITIETHTRTNGYVGFGLSSNGKMFPADVVVGWVDGFGQAHLHDYHTVEHVTPILDHHQDWTLLHGSEDQSGTVLKFVRKLDTCDKEDIAITDDTLRVIFAYHDGDPISSTNFMYHGVNRGSKSALFLSNPLDADDVTIPSDTQTFDLLNDHYHIPATTTTYHCTAFQLPPMNKKHHIVKFEPVVQQGHELTVHHIVVYACDRTRNYTKYAGKDYRCRFDANMPEDLQECGDVFLAWAIGGGAFYYPPNAGVPIGTEFDPTFFVMETHYDNPTARGGMVDTSGLRIHYTPTLRYYDVGLLQLGLGVSTRQIIPPGEKAFLSAGYCPYQNLNKEIPPGGFNAFALVQHSHLLARSVRTKHYRAGTELKPLAEDFNYDFNYQEARSLTNNRVVLPGDSLAVECIYDSTGRSNVTFGGFSTKEEMCITFLFYYPRMMMPSCVSVPMYDKLMPYDQGINGGLERYVKKVNWTDPAEHTKFYNALHESTHYMYASDLRNKSANIYTIEKEIDPKVPYVRPHLCPKSDV